MTGIRQECKVVVGTSESTSSVLYHCSPSLVLNLLVLILLGLGRLCSGFVGFFVMPGLLALLLIGVPNIFLSPVRRCSMRVETDTTHLYSCYQCYGRQEDLALSR